MMGKIRTSLEVLSLGLGLFTAEALYSGNERFYRDWFLPAARFVVRDGETAHNLSLYAASHGFIPRKPRNVFPSLKCKVFGLEFDHPVGLAAGFDKNGEAFMDLLNVGFSHIEVGTVTPNPQPGNSRPRIFRWTEKNAIINRCGFNNDGHDTVYERLKNRPWEGRGVLGVNLGCNKTSIDPTSDYVAGVRKFGEVADYLVINVSSPNTPGLRSLQAKDKLRCLLSKVLTARNELSKKTPILLKISPDENDQSLVDIVEVALDSKVSGCLYTLCTSFGNVAFSDLDYLIKHPQANVHLKRLSYGHVYGFFKESFIPYLHVNKSLLLKLKLS
ncbi:Dihydroorotate dehydrogenase [Schistosoma japonicum]|nr:Dihydroorotate dehydrogenase [Schistosoma japonicum]